MRKSTAAFAVASLVVGALLLAGCTSWFENPNKPANAAIGVANAHLKTAASLEATVKADAASLASLAYTKSGAKNALKLTAAINTALTTERNELTAAKTAMDGIAKLDVEAPLKKYATLESASIDARIVLVDAYARLYGAMDSLYSNLAGGSAGADNADMATAIQQMQKEVASLTDAATAAAQTAADYFTANKLGG